MVRPRTRMSFAGVTRTHHSPHHTTHVQQQQQQQQHSNDDDDDDDDAQRTRPLIQLQPLTTMTTTTVDSRQRQQTTKYDLQQQNSVRVSVSLWSAQSMLVCLLLHNDEVRCKLFVCVALRCSCYYRRQLCSITNHLLCEQCVSVHLIKLSSWHLLGEKLIAVHRRSQDFLGGAEHRTRCSHSSRDANRQLVIEQS